MRTRAAIGGWLACIALLASMPAGAGAAGIEPVYGSEHALPPLPSPVIGAQGVAADAAGGTYAIDGNRVLELAAGGGFGSQQVLPFTGLSGPSGIAVDAAGDTFVADTGNARVVELDAGGTAQRVLPFSGLQAPNAVAVDIVGDVFVADRSAVLELPAGSSTSQVLPFGTGILPTGVAVDSQGDVYVVNGGGAGDVEELAAGATSPTPVPGLTGRTVAVGPDDELYVGGHGGVEEFPPPPGASSPDQPLPLAGVSDVTGVAATARGLYVSDFSGAVYFEPAGATPPAGEAVLPFSGAAPGTPTSLAADGSGNIYEVLSGRLVVQPADGHDAQLAPVLGQVTSVSADGLGTVYATLDDPSGNPAIAEWHVGTGTATTRYEQNDRIEQIAADARGNVFWSETHQGPFADIGTVFRLPPGGDTGQALPFPNIHDPVGMASSAAGDVYVSSDGGLVRVVRAGAGGSSIVPFAVPVGPLGLDQSNGVYGLTETGAALLPAGACQADQVVLPLTGLNAPQGIAVDPRGDVFVADSGNRRVVALPATGTVPVPACPLRLSRFRLSANGSGKPSLRFTLTSRSARGIRTVTIALPSGRLRFARRRALKRGLTLRTKHSRHPAYRVRHRGGQQIVITLKRATRRLSLTFGRGALFLSSTPGVIYGEGATTIVVRGRSGRPIPLSVSTLTR